MVFRREERFREGFSRRTQSFQYGKYQRLPPKFTLYYSKTYDPKQVGNIDGTTGDLHDRQLEKCQTRSNVLCTTGELNSVSRNSRKTLYVGCLDVKVEEEDVRELCERYGEVSFVRVVRDAITGVSRGYAFVEFKRSYGCDKAYKYLGNHRLGVKKLIVDYERGRNMEGWYPRRLGGGFGGNIKSGQIRFGGRYKPFKRTEQVVDFIHKTKRPNNSSCLQNLSRSEVRWRELS